MVLASAEASTRAKQVRLYVEEDPPVDPTSDDTNFKAPARRCSSAGVAESRRASMSEKWRTNSNRLLISGGRFLTRADTKDYVVQVVSTAQVHGIRELASATTLRARVFWMLLCTACLCAASFFIYNIIMKYRNDRIATKITIESQAKMQYPTVLYCPVRWMHASKLSQYGLNSSHQSYIRTVMGDPHDGQDDDLFNENYETDLKRIANRFNFSTVGDLMLAVSLDNNGLHCAGCHEKEIRKVATLNGVCFVIPLWSTLYQTENLPTIVQTPYDVLPVGPPPEENIISPTGEGKEQGAFISIIDNQTKIGIEIHDSIYIRSKMTTLIKLEYSQIHRYNSAKRPCHHRKPEETTPSAAYCELKCIDDTKNQQCRHCSKFSLFEADWPYPQCSKSISLWTQDSWARCNQTEIEDQLLKCKERCLPICNENIYRISSIMQLSRSEFLTLRFIFPSFTATVYTDVETISTDTLISSIGGQTGLWLGASVVSLCQLLSYCCCPCLHWDNLQSRYHSFRRSLSRKTLRRRPRRQLDV